MLIFVLKIFVPHKGHFLPSLDQFSAHIAALDGPAYLGLMAAWYGFGVMFVFGTLLAPYFLLCSVQFLRAGGHHLSDQDVMETAGWFGIPLSLGMYGNVSSFAALALTLFAWYRKSSGQLARTNPGSANEASMVVLFSLGFMALNIAGPGALGQHTAVTATALVASLAFSILALVVFFSYFRVFRRDFAALFFSRSQPQDRASQEKRWGRILNLAPQ